MISTLLHIARGVAHRAATAHERSPEWKTFRKHFLEKNPCCAACGTKLFLEAHHVTPFETNPDLELDEENLIPLCHLRGHHLLLGHGDNFRFYVRRVRELARQVYVGTRSAKEAAEVAKDERVPIRAKA